MSKYLIAQTDGSLLDSSTNGAYNTSITGTVAATGDANLEGTTNQIGDDLKTAYNKLTGYTKIDNRPAEGTSAGTYALQVRGYHRDTSGTFIGVDCEADMYTTGTGSIRGTQGVGKVRAGITATDSTIIGIYGQARVDDTGIMAGNSFLVGLYGLIEASPAVTANHVTSCWLDSHQANAVTGVHDLLYMTNNGAAVMDQAIHLYGPSITNFIKLDTCSTFVTDTAETGGSSKKIAIDIDGTTYYINAYTG